MELLTLVWIASILISTYLGIQKGIPVLGFINGLILGPIGLFIVIIQDNNKRSPCPSCAELIMKTASKCPYCKETIKKN